jgi:hypothetical protein
MKKNKQNALESSTRTIAFNLAKPFRGGVNPLTTLVMGLLLLSNFA